MTNLLPALVAALIHPVWQPSAAELELRLQGLLETGRVLYVAAHPDDENTQFLAWAVGERGYDAAYLSLTRGDGGQNLIGDEHSELLGVIRTWELLTARTVDGARQLIGGAIDFGYSKTAEETLAIWGEEATLADLVWVIRSFRPHVVVTRFPEQGTTHGHHLASARLARAAFEAAGDPERFPEAGEPWRPVRLVHNVPRWTLENGADTSGMIPVDVGGYNALLGRSYGEISAASRSHHQSQAFGSASTRGPQNEYFQWVAGDPATTDLFEGIDTSWAALEGGAAVDGHLRAALEAFDSRNPAAAVPALIEAHRAVAAMAQPPFAPAQLGELIAACLGLTLDVRAARPVAVPGGNLEVTWSAVLRNPGDVALREVRLGDTALSGERRLAVHEVADGTTTWTVPAETPLSAPYWLAEPPGAGRWADPPAELRGEPLAPGLQATFALTVDGYALELTRPVRHVSVDPVLGERVRGLTVAPPVTLTPTSEVVMATGEAAIVELEAVAYADVTADVRLEGLVGWVVEPTTATIDLVADQPARVVFRVTPPAGAERTEARPTARVAGGDWSQRADVIDYPHIPVQTVLRPSIVALQPLELAPFTGTVGYVMGPGDLVASSLSAVGIDVRLLEDRDITATGLAGLDAVVIGIRAFNTRPALHDRLDALLEWVGQGGTLLVQYQTNNRATPLDRPIGPAPLTVGRDRITLEGAAVQRLVPQHRLWSTPHVLEEADFAGWVQERGLYFAETWAPAWTPMISMADPGEEPLTGGLMLAEHGEGVVVYTGLSLFRQLPAGVPGAYRLTVNLLSLGGT